MGNDWDKGGSSTEGVGLALRFRALTVQFLLSVGLRAGGALLALSINILMARALGVSEFGRYMTQLSAVLLLSALAVRGTDQLLTRELAATGRTDANVRRSLRDWVVARVSLGAAVAAVTYVLWTVVNSQGGGVESSYWQRLSPALILLGVSTICSLEAGALNGYSCSLRSQALISSVRVFGVLVLFAIVSVSAGVPRSAEDALWLEIGGYFLALIVGLHWLRSVPIMNVTGLVARRGANENCSRASNWARSSRHFLLVTIAALLVNRLDVMLVSSLAGTEAAGLYAAGARLAQAALMVAIAVNVVLSPRFAAAWERGEHAVIWRLFRLGITFTIPVAIVEGSIAVFWGKNVVSVFGPGYSEAAAPFTWVTVAYALWAVAAPGYALLAMTGSERTVAFLSWIVLIVNAVAMVLLVPSYGPMGGGIAMTAGYGVVLVLLLGQIGQRRKVGALMANDSLRCKRSSCHE